MRLTHAEWGELGLIDETESSRRDALAALMREHEAPLYRLLVVLTGDRDVALDCVQDTFTRAYEHLRKGRTVTTPWLYGVRSDWVPHPTAALLALMVAGLRIYCGAWAVERFLGWGWYSVALLRGFGVAGIAVFVAALVAAGLLLLRARLLPARSLAPLIVGTLAILLFLLGAASGMIGREQIYLHQDQVALLFGLLWLPLGIALLTVKAVPRYMAG